MVPSNLAFKTSHVDKNLKQKVWGWKVLQLKFSLNLSVEEVWYMYHIKCPAKLRLWWGCVTSFHTSLLTNQPNQSKIMVHLCKMTMWLDMKYYQQFSQLLCGLPVAFSKIFLNWKICSLKSVFWSFYAYCNKI